MNSFQLYKDTVSSNLENLFGGFSTKKKKKNSTILKIVGFSVLIIVGFVPLATIYGLSLKSIGQAYGYNYVYSLLNVFLIIGTLFFNLFGTYSALYLSTDIKNLYFLPLEDRVVFRARIYQALTTTTPFVVVLLYITIVGMNFQIGWILYSILSFIASLVLTITVCVLISYILRKIAKNKPIVKTILYIIFAASFFGLIIFSNIKQGNQQIVDMTKLFPILDYFGFITITSNNIFFLIIYLVLTIFIYYLVETLLVKNYSQILYVYEAINKSKKIKDDKSYDSLFKQLIKREFDIIHGEKAFTSECYVSVFLPVLMFVVIVVNRKFIELGVIALIVFTATLVFVNMGTVAIIMFSREGKTFRVIQSLPIDVKKYLKVKQFVALIFSLPVGLITLLVMGIITKTSFLYVLASIITYVIISITILTFDLFLDVIKPKFDWDNAMVLQKRSIKALIGFAISFAYVALSVGVFLLLFLVLKINLYICISIFVVIVLTLFILSQYLYYKKGITILDAKE